MKLTTPPVMEQTPVLEPSTVMVHRGPRWRWPSGCRWPRPRWRARCGRGEGDGLGALAHREGLLHLGRRVVVGVAGLVGVECAGAGSGEATTTAAGDGADGRARGVDGDGHREARGGGGGRGVGGAADGGVAGAVEVKVMVWFDLLASANVAEVSPGAVAVMV